MSDDPSARRRPHETISRERLFAQMPDSLIDDLRVSPLAVRVWAKLDRYAGKDGNAFPSRRALAGDLGVSIPTISRALSELVNTGWITRTERAGGVWHTHLNDRPRIKSDAGTRITDDAGSDHVRSGTRIKSDPQKENQRRRATKKNSSSSSARSAPTTTNRGTRLPADFQLAETMISWARANAPKAGPRDHERFVDYWIAQPGAKGLKLDWLATWRNWMRKASDDREQRTAGKASTTDERVQQAQSLRHKAAALDAQDALVLDGTPRFAIGATQ